MSSLAVGIAVLLATTIGVGIAVRCAGRRGPIEPCPWSIAALTGACCLAAALPALFLVGVPRSAVLGAAPALAAWSWWRWGRAALRRPDRRDLAYGAVLSFALIGPLLLAATGPLAEDAALVWWPKVDEVAAGRWPELHRASLLHNNPGYPRGMAWLTNLASSFTVPTPATMKVVAFLFTWLAALAMVAVARGCRRERAGFLLALTFVVLPDVALQAGLGMADGAVGAAVLLAAIGLTTRLRTADGYTLAMMAAIGAPSLKEEGKLVLLVVVAFVLHDLLRRELSWRRAVALGAPLGVLVPFWWASIGDKATRLDVLPTLLRNPDILVTRAAAVLEQMLRSIGDGPVWIGIAVLASLLGLLPRAWPRLLAASPALVFLPVVIFVYVATGVPVRWHVATTVERLMIEVAPTLLLAAGLRLAPAAPADAVRA